MILATGHCLQPVCRIRRSHVYSGKQHLVIFGSSVRQQPWRRALGNCDAETRDQRLLSVPDSQAALQRGLNLPVQIAELTAVGALGIAWVLCNVQPATARPLPMLSMQPQVETIVPVSSPASVTASVTHPNDSMLMIVAVCLGFWMLSATISAAIGGLMHLSGRSLSYGTRAAGTWTSAGILDTFDIMRLPLAYEIEEPSRTRPGRSVRREVIYQPWDGPQSYIPINMVKVLEPGLREAGLVMRNTLLPPSEDLSIIRVTGRDVADAGDVPSNGTNGQGAERNNGHSNGHSNGSSSNGKGA